MSTAIVPSGDNEPAAPLSGGMKALTIWQPWASLIAEGAKTIETRSWSAPASLIGQRIAIHAAKHHPYRDLDHLPGDVENGYEWRWLGDWRIAWDYEDRTLRLDLWNEQTEQEVDAPFGAVVATAVLADCLPIIGPGDEIDLSRPYIAESGDRLYEWLEDEPQINITDQAPYGDFTPGRWGWVLEEVHGLPEPIPAKGRQGVWRWQP